MSLERALKELGPGLIDFGARFGGFGVRFDRYRGPCWKDWGLGLTDLGVLFEGFGAGRGAAGLGRRELSSPKNQKINNDNFTHAMQTTIF